MNQDELMNKKIKAKQVTIFPDEEHRDRCPVWVIYKYHTLLPLKRKSSALYLQP